MREIERERGREGERERKREREKEGEREREGATERERLKRGNFPETEVNYIQHVCWPMRSFPWASTMDVRKQ